MNPLWQGFVDKIAGIGHLQRKMQPGDIVLMTPKPDDPNAGFLEKGVSSLFSTVSHALQGDYTHSGIYMGHGRVVDIRAETGIREVPLRDFSKVHGLAIVRPKVSPEARALAVTKAKKYLDEKKVQYSLPNLVPAVAGSFINFSDRKVDPNKVICSTLIANAYSKNKIVPGQARFAVKPSDFLNSPNVELIGKHERPDVKAQS